MIAPTLDLVGTVGRSENATLQTLGTKANSAALGVQLNVPIYQGGAIDARVREAIAASNKSQTDLEYARRTAEQGVRTAFLGVNSGLAQVRALEAAERSSQLALDSNLLGYQVGVRINIDVLNAQQQLFTTRRDLAKARYDVLVNGLRVREAVLQLAVMHPQKAALELFAREIAPAGTSWAPGTTGASGRPSPSPCIKQYAFLLDKARLQPVVDMDGVLLAVDVPHSQPTVPTAAAPPVRHPVETARDHPADREVPLIRLAWARSGDKGNTSNIGVIARDPQWLPLLREELTPERVEAWLAHLVQGPVTRYEVPGIHALNFVCEQALDGGGMASLRNDPLGKGMAQILLTMPVQVPEALL